MNDTERRAQDFRWYRLHSNHGHLTYVDMMRCDEDVAHAINDDDATPATASDLRIGDVIRWDEHTNLTVMRIENVDGGHHFLLTLAGPISERTGLDAHGVVFAFPGRRFMIF